MKLSRQMGDIREASTSCVQRCAGPTLIQDHLSPVSAAPGVDVSSSACPPPPCCPSSLSSSSRAAMMTEFQTGWLETTEMGSS